MTPAKRQNQLLRQRNEYRAGKAAEKRDRCNGAPVVQGDHPSNDGEDRVVEDHRAGGANPDPDGIELPELRDLRPENKENRTQERAQYHQAPPALSIDPVTNSVRQEFGRPEAAGQRPVHLSARPAQFGLHRMHEDGEGVVEGSPGHELAQGQGQDEEPWKAAGGPRRAFR